MIDQLEENLPEKKGLSRDSKVINQTNEVVSQRMQSHIEAENEIIEKSEECLPAKQEKEGDDLEQPKT